MQQTIGDCAGVVAGQIFRKSPYMLGNGFSLGAVCLNQFVIWAKMWYVRACALKKSRIVTGEVEDDRRVETGDWTLDFKYQL